MISNSAVQRDINHVLHGFVELSRHREQGAKVITGGKGVFIYDEAGTPYLEGIAGMWCTAFGFGEPELVEAATRQLNILPYYHTLAYKTVTPAIELAEQLAARMPMKNARIYFGLSGSEANDFTVKMLCYYNNVLGRPLKKKIISRLGGYHGATMVAASMTGIPAMHRDFDVPLPGFLHVSEPNYFKNGLPGESEAAFADRLIAEIAALIEVEGPETIAGFIAEPIMGAGGVIIPPEGYYKKLVPLLRQHDIAFIADEVITGFLRTGNFWGCETMGFVPDTLSSAKGLTSAYQPLSAVGISEEIYEGLVLGSQKGGYFGHGATYSGHPVGCAVALKVLDLIERRDMAGHVARVSKVFLARLEKLGELPYVAQTRGRGLMGAVEFKFDPTTKAGFEPVGSFARRIVAIAEERHHLIIRPLPGGDICAFSPPLIISEAEVNEMFDRFERALADACDELTAPVPMGATA